MVVVGVGAVLQRALGELGAGSVHGGAILCARDQSLHLMAYVIGGRDGLVLGVQIGLGEEASEAGKGLGQEGTGDSGCVIFIGGCWVLLEEAVLDDEDVHGGLPGADEVVGPGLAVPGSMERVVSEGSIRDVGRAVDGMSVREAAELVLNDVDDVPLRFTTGVVLHLVGPNCDLLLLVLRHLRLTFEGAGPPEGSSHEHGNEGVELLLEDTADKQGRGSPRGCSWQGASQRVRSIGGSW